MSRGADDSSSAAADEGTCAHWAAEHLLRGTHDARSVVGLKEPKTGVVVTADMVQDVLPYVRYVQDLVTSTGGELFIEQKIAIGAITGEHDAHGTADAVIVTHDEIIIVDLKFGRGIEVDAVENKQLQIYALGALQQFTPLAAKQTQEDDLL
jgi:hypothetical protein